MWEVGQCKAVFTTGSTKHVWKIICILWPKVITCGKSLVILEGVAFDWYQHTCATFTLVIPSCYCLPSIQLFFCVCFVFGRFSPSGACKNCIRISIAQLEKDQVTIGTELLCRAIREYLSKTPWEQWDPTIEVDTSPVFDELADNKPTEKQWTVL